MIFYVPLDPDPGRSRGFYHHGGHDGIDYNARYQDCLAAQAGVVYSIRNEPGGYGLLIDLTHADGWLTRYAHLSDVHVEWGQEVRAGQVIGVTGNTGASTGPHLHFETRHHGRPLDPDPLLIGPAPAPDPPRPKGRPMPPILCDDALGRVWIYDPYSRTATHIGDPDELNALIREMMAAGVDSSIRSDPDARALIHHAARVGG